MKWIAVVTLALGLTGCGEGCSRSIKSMRSNYGGGLNRTCKVMGWDGSVIKEYTGKFDIQDSSVKVYFDLNGKRTQIYNSMVICDEL